MCEFKILYVTYTSYIYKYNDTYILKKVLLYNDYHIYERETFILDLLKNNGITWCPTILVRDDEQKIMVMNYCGTKLTKENSPSDTMTQMRRILEDLKRFDIQHNDIKVDEILVKDGNLYLCDFGWASIHHNLSCGVGFNKTNLCEIRPDSSVLTQIEKNIGKDTTIYLSTGRALKGSQSETPTVRRIGDEFHVGGYQAFSLNKESITYKSKVHKYNTVSNVLKSLKSECESVNDIGSNTGVAAYTAHFCGYSTIYALDHDKDCIPILREINTGLGISSVIAQQYSFGDSTEATDITIMLALIHWIYSCTSLKFLAFDPIFKYLKTVTKKYLLIEWIDPSDGAIQQFHHIDFNKEKQTQEYTKANFEASLTSQFGDILSTTGVDGATRILYIVRRRGE